MYSGSIVGFSDGFFPDPVKITAYLNNMIQQKQYWTMKTNTSADIQKECRLRSTIDHSLCWKEIQREKPPNL